MKKFFSYAWKIALIIIILLGIGFWWLASMMFQDNRFYLDAGFKFLTLDLLQIPYSSYKTNITSSVKSDIYDLEPISYEEWMEMECECHDTASGTYDHGLPSARTKDLRMLGVEGQKHIMCLQPNAFIRKWFANVMPEDCTSQFNCDTMKIQVYDYILKYPKVLNNLIKIAEKPCYYVKELPKEKPILPSLSTKDKETADREWKEYYDLDQTRDELHCDNNDRPRSIIRILDKTGQAKYDIIIPRLDTARLGRR